ncbi:hypothetical protein ACFLYU_01375 [Candidatus Dependentiae bacterium]
MKIFKNKLLSLVVVSTIVFSSVSSVNIYPGCLSFFWGSKKVAKTHKISGSFFSKLFAGAGAIFLAVTSVYLAYKNWFADDGKGNGGDGKNGSNGDNKSDVTNSDNQNDQKDNIQKNSKDSKYGDKKDPKNQDKQNNNQSNNTREEIVDIEEKPKNSGKDGQKNKDNKNNKNKQKGGGRKFPQLPRKPSSLVHAYKKKNGELNLAPHIKHYKNIDNVEYIQLKTVDQFNSKVKSNAKKSATCGTLSIRNAYWMYNFFRTPDYARKEHFLREINSQGNAKKYLEKLTDEKKETVWLIADDIDRRIRRMSELKKKKDENFNMTGHVTVLDTVLLLENGAQNHILERFRKFENYYHVFLVNTGDVFSGVLRDMFENEKRLVEQQRNNKIKNRWFEDFKAGGRSGNHWYVVALEKRGSSIKCYIIDTAGGANHIKGLDGKKQSLGGKRNKYLCDYIINGYSSVRFREAIAREGRARFLNSIILNKKPEDIFENPIKPKPQTKKPQKKKKSKIKPKKPRKINKKSNGRRNIGRRGRKR